MKLAIALPMLLLSLSSAMAETISIRADAWCPFNCDPKSDRPGYMIEIAKAALEPLGHTIDYQTLNWARAISETRKGKFVAIVGSSQADAPDFVFPSERMGVASNCFFVKKDSTWAYKEEGSLAQVTIGVIKDYTYGEPIDSYVQKHAKDPKRIDVVTGDNPLELNLKKLNLGRISTFIEEESVMHNYFFSRKLEENVKSVGCVKQDSLFIAFAPQHPKAKEYAQILTEKVQSMRKDGSLSKLLALYGLKDWK